MPSYKVTSPGFYNGLSYKPNGKRPVLHLEKPFPKEKGKEKIPSWLAPISSKDAEAIEKQEGELHTPVNYTEEELAAERAHVTFIESNVETL